MTLTRAPSWLPLTGILALVTLGLVALLVGFAGDRTGRLALMTGVEVLTENAAGEAVGPDQIAALPATAWASWTKPGFVPGGAQRGVWVRVRLANPGAAPLVGVLADAEGYADRVDLYVREENATGAWRNLRSGESVASQAKALRGRNVAFPLLVPAGGERTVLLRYEDRIALWLELTWWPEAGDFHGAVQRGLVAESAYFGMLLALLLYNLVLWLRVRFPGTGVYLLFLGTFIAFMVLARHGLGIFGVAWGSPWLEASTSFTMALSGAFLAEFSRQVLELPERLPRADRVARAVKLLMVAMVAAVPVGIAVGFTGIFSVVLMATTAAHLALFGVAVAAWRVGVGSARYYLPAFGFLFSGFLPLLSLWVPTLSLEDTSQLVMVGTLLEMLLLSVAIADRFAGLQRDKIAAQALAMAEADQGHVLQEAYADDLEHEVSTRTGELLAANADKDRMIAVLGHDLRGPLAALTRSAEDLVRETRIQRERDEFVVDAARTGRALLQVLEDIVLWARVRAGTGKEADHAVAAIVGPATELHRALAAQRGITLAVMVDPAPPLRVRVDSVLGQTFVRNLASNAVKSARTRVEVRVAIVAIAEPADGAAGERVRITIADDGPGLPGAVSEALRVERLETAKNADSNTVLARSGLGLRLCVEIAQALGTRLEAGASSGGGDGGASGTEISFTLPRAGN